MKNSPQLLLLSRPSFRDDYREFLESQGLDWVREDEATDAELLVEFSGRVCYMSFGADRQAPGNSRGYIERLIEKGHESVLEHAQFTFLLYNVSRAFTHQLVRHRVGFAFSQLSQQYHDETDAEFIIPHGIEEDEVLSEHWDDIVRKIGEFYDRAKQAQVGSNLYSAKERSRRVRSMSRAILPNATSTVVSVSANARALRHFLSVRGALEGDIEMRLVSDLVYQMLETEAPSFVFDFESRILSDGLPLVSRSSQSSAPSEA